MELDRRNFIRLATGWLAHSYLVSRLDAKDDPLTIEIRREAVDSRSIASIGFHAELRVLEIEFRSGALYRYFSVPRSIFEGMQKAASKGRYFSQNIRGHFDFQRRENVKP
ncbi:MAG: KTSC domain-containing protein [Chthoniobacteraceae bacterium]